jgi:hypothetical protein
MTNLDFLPMIHPDASGGTFRIYRKKKQEIYDKDTKGLAVEPKESLVEAIRW